MTPDIQKAKHLEWLVESRAKNQRAALELIKLLDRHPNVSASGLFETCQTLIAICFSLWRAAFLADKTGVRETTLAHARKFLETVLADNAINYTQDRAGREWTFNYYMNNAKDGLLALAKRWPSITELLSRERKPEAGSTTAQRRWDRYQVAFEAAIECLRMDLSRRSK